VTFSNVTRLRGSADFRKNRFMSSVVRIEMIDNEIHYQ